LHEQEGADKPLSNKLPSRQPPNNHKLNQPLMEVVEVVAEVVAEEEAEEDQLLPRVQVQPHKLQHQEPTAP